MSATGFVQYGGIRLKVSEQGGLVALELSQRALSASPGQLARDIVLLCRWSAQRMQVKRRSLLLDSGFGATVVDSLGLATEAELADTEKALGREGAAETEQLGWSLRRQA
jgi:hypothetical protein